MADPTTANIQLFQPTRGSDTGVWDVPVNGNMGILDLILGGVATVSLNNANVTLASSQYESKTITFNSTLTGNVIITFPTSFIKSYEIYNICTGSSAFTVTLQTSAGGQIVCAPPGETVEIWNDGSNLRYKNMDRVGTYWDYAGSSVPAWISGCTVPPYLNCDGTTFSSGTYPQLTTILGSTTLPDSRGRFRAALNQFTGRMQSSVSIDGNTIFTGGGSQFVHGHSHSNSLTDPGHTHTVLVFAPNFSGNNIGGTNGGSLGNTGVTNSAVTGVTINNAGFGLGNTQNVPPAYIGGLTLIRAA